MEVACSHYAEITITRNIVLRENCPILFSVIYHLTIPREGGSVNLHHSVANRSQWKCSVSVFRAKNTREKFKLLLRKYWSEKTTCIIQTLASLYLRKYASNVLKVCIDSKRPQYMSFSSFIELTYPWNHFFAIKASNEICFSDALLILVFFVFLCASLFFTKRLPLLLFIGRMLINRRITFCLAVQIAIDFSYTYSFIEPIYSFYQLIDWLWLHNFDGNLAAWQLWHV